MEIAGDTPVAIGRQGFSAGCWAKSGQDADYPLSEENIKLLFRNKIPFIRIPDFASTQECETIISAAEQHTDFNSYRNVEPRIDRIGNTVFEYNNVSAESYFADSVEAARLQDLIFADSFDAVGRMMQCLNRRTGMSVRRATRANGTPYYAGLIRRIEQGTLLHIDFAPAEQGDWDVANVIGQLAWNLYLRTAGANDGRTHIYERQWQSSDNAHREGSYGYAWHLVEGSRKANFLPRVGEVVIFNTRNFHYVDSTSGERVTVTSAIGNLPHGELVLWS